MTDPDRGVPVVYNIHRLEREIVDQQLGRAPCVVTASPDGRRWFRARPAGYAGWLLGRRLRIAWRVFTGQYDALAWDYPPAEVDRAAMEAGRG